MFGNKKDKIKCNNHKKLFIPPPPPPKEVVKIREMLKQVEVWINLGEKELAGKHWMLIAYECRKYGNISSSTCDEPVIKYFRDDNEDSKYTDWDSPPMGGLSDW